MHRRAFLKWALCGCVALTSGQPVEAGKRESLIPERVANSYIIIRGKVTATEEKNVSAIPYPGAKGADPYQIAVIKVDEVIRGDKGLTQVRLGSHLGLSTPAVGLEGCFFIQKHCADSFFVPAASILSKNDPNYDQDLALAKRCAGLLAAPDAGLKSKDAEERSLTACLLITRYRTQRTPNAKTEPVPLEQSRLILEALAESDWNKINLTHFSFERLRLTEKDGWKPTPGQLVIQAPQWLKANAGTYRLHRFVDAN